MSGALELYQAGRHAEALAASNAALGADPADTVAGHALGCALAMLGRAGDLERLALHFNAATGAGWAMVAETLHRLLGDGHHAQLAALAQATAQDSPLHILSLYYDGCSRLAQGDTAGAVERFDWFRRHVRFYAGHIPFASHPLLSMIYRQGRLVAAPDEVDARMEAGTGQDLPRLDHLGGTGAAAPGAPLLFTCFDERYFRLFGRAFAEANRALNPTTPLALHVIAPSDDSLADLAAMARAWPGLFAASTEHQPLFSTVTYYASARFFVADQLMERHHRPLISLDAELKSPVEGLDIAGRCQGDDFACFATGRDEPGSVWQASVMWFGRTAAARRFISFLQAYCRPELNHPSLLTWQLDQAALLALRHRFAARSDPLAFADLGQRLGLALADAVSDIAPPETKEADKHAKMSDEVRALGPGLGELYARL